MKDHAEDGDEMGLLGELEGSALARRAEGKRETHPHFGSLKELEDDVPQIFEIERLVAGADTSVRLGRALEACGRSSARGGRG